MVTDFTGELAWGNSWKVANTIAHLKTPPYDELPMTHCDDRHSFYTPPLTLVWKLGRPASSSLHGFPLGHIYVTYLNCLESKLGSFNLLPKNSETSSFVNYSFSPALVWFCPLTPALGIQMCLVFTTGFKSYSEKSCFYSVKFQRTKTNPDKVYLCKCFLWLGSW